MCVTMGERLMLCSSPVTPPNGTDDERSGCGDQNLGYNNYYADVAKSS